MMLRSDLNIIQQWIKPDSHVLDLGCGSGELLSYLKRHKGVTGYGLEIDPDNISHCIAQGVNVIEHNLDQGLERFADDSFDLTKAATHHCQDGG
jgi:methionine biosynthesis protein MetW